MSKDDSHSEYYEYDVASDTWTFLGYMPYHIRFACGVATTRFGRELVVSSKGKKA